MQELDKLNFKISAFQMDKKDIWALSSVISYLKISVVSLAKNWNEDNFKNLSQEFDSTVLDLVNQKRFFPYEYVGDFEKFKEKFPSKEKIDSLLTGKKLVIKSMNMF